MLVGSIKAYNSTQNVVNWQPGWCDATVRTNGRLWLSIF